MVARSSSRRSWTGGRRVTPGWDGASFGALGVVALLVGTLTACDVPEGSAADTEETLTASPRAGSTEAAAPVAEETFVVPQVVGMVLQDAQDLLQGLGSSVMDQEDASGQGRMQIDDSNWTVCSQDPAAGVEAPLTATILLSSVKLDEICPDGMGDVVEEPASPPPDETEDASPPEEPEEPAAPDMTASQEQAIRMALSYLDYSAFSKSGLVDQLEFEGFSNEDATVAVSSIEVDWKEQAALQAQSYLDYSAFSRSGLIEQLLFEGFTQKQAEYGVDAVGL